MTPISGTTRIAAVIGSPVAHSLSPALHNAAFAASGLDWRFVALEVREGQAVDAVAAMQTLGIGGFAVTMPHKHDVAMAVDEVDESARALNSVNTVVLRDDGSTFGASTDGVGLVNCLADAGVDVASSRCVVLGAGAAGRSIIDALGRAGVTDIAVVNRTRAAAQQAAELAEPARVGTVDDVARADVVINATSVGMGSPDMPLDPKLIGAHHVVADIVYHPLETALLAAARGIGARAIDGLGMLVHQAALQQELWTGVRPDVRSMRAAAEAELSARSE